DQCQTCHPNSVLPAHRWSSEHAKEARRDLHLCRNCHEDADVCIKCHSARTGLRINPHPRDWHTIKGNLRRAADGRTCRMCH
ncbi:MAG: cytochrome C, partial [bacterium]